MLKNIVKEFITEEDGIGVVEIILILVILIGLVVIFQEQIGRIVKNAFKSINDGSKGINDHDYGVE
jgi:Flp pilus assembly pilin Flp